MNWQQVKTNWKNVQDQVHTKWAKLTDTDLKEIAGRRAELIRRVQRRYAMKKETAEKEVETFIETLH